MISKSKKGLISLVLAVTILTTFSNFAMTQVKELHIAINKSPWLPAFEKLTKMYEGETGVKMVLHVFPFMGLYEKELAAVTTASKTYDLMNMNEIWGPFFYAGRYLTPLKEIDPEFTVPSHLMQFFWEGYWDDKVHYQAPTGVLYGIHVNGNVHLLQYREDKYKEAGLPTPPETWDDVLEAARKLFDPPNFYGYVIRGARGDPIFYNSMTIRHAYNGYMFRDPLKGDFTITVNDEKNVEAWEMYARNLNEYGPPGVGNIGQTEMMGLLASGRALQAIVVSAAFPHLDDPEFSAVPFKIQFAVPPKGRGGDHSSTVAGWTMVVPRFISDERKKAALDFLKWSITQKPQVEYTKMGGVPVSTTVFQSELMRDPKYRFLKATQDSIPYFSSMPLIPECAQIRDVMGLHLNRALIEEEGVRESLDKTAQEILEIMRGAGYKGVTIAPRS